MERRFLVLSTLGVLALAAGCGGASPAVEPATSTPPAGDELVCGPQSPRDISSPAGANSVPVPGGETPYLCNVHFHDPFEHSGFASVPEVAAAPGSPVCESVEVGDRVEFHWVYTNCEPKPVAEKGLDNCVCDREDLVLRVFAQAYVVAESGEAPAQPSADLVGYAGSTTGTKYDDKTCSPARVNWQVAKNALLVGKSELGAWCESNPWIDEHHPHGSRAVVTDPAWLSAM